MARRAPKNNRTATQTNDNLVRVYVRDWRSEPVGRVKRALRQEIAEWELATQMEDYANADQQTEPDVDAIRHVNQFGTPSVPVMEVACLPEKRDLVLNFFQENNIQIWEDINPFLENSVTANDDSPDARRFRKAHLTRLLLAWWKAVNFLQSRDTSLYYQRLINAAVRGPDNLHPWPPGIVGISIDARGVSDAKSNPSIDFEYAPGR